MSPQCSSLVAVPGVPSRLTATQGPTFRKALGTVTIDLKSRSVTIDLKSLMILSSGFVLCKQNPRGPQSMEPHFPWDPSSPHPPAFPRWSLAAHTFAPVQRSEPPRGGWTQVQEGLGLGLWVLPPKSQGGAQGPVRVCVSSTSAHAP